MNPLHPVLITFEYTFKLLLHSCTHSSYSPCPALLYTRPCTPLPALLYTKYLRCKGTSSTIYYTHIQVIMILQALHSFTIWRPRGPAHHALHSDPFTPSTHGVKALYSPSACSVKTLHSPRTFCAKALHSPSTCGTRPYYICTTRYTSNMH